MPLAQPGAKKESAGLSIPSLKAPFSLTHKCPSYGIYGLFQHHGVSFKEADSYGAKIACLFDTRCFLVDIVGADKTLYDYALFIEFVSLFITMR
jgi:hypothetical protein